MSLPLPGERAVPAGASAYTRDKEDHLCSLLAEHTAGGGHLLHWIWYNGAPPELNLSFMIVKKWMDVFQPLKFFPNFCSAISFGSHGGGDPIYTTCQGILCTVITDIMTWFCYAFSHVARSLFHY